MHELAKLLPVLSIGYVLVGFSQKKVQCADNAKSSMPDDPILYRAHHLSVIFGLITMTMYLTNLRYSTTIFAGLLGCCFVGAIFGFVFGLFLTVARRNRIYFTHACVSAILLSWPLAYLLHFVPQ